MANANDVEIDFQDEIEDKDEADGSQGPVASDDAPEDEKTEASEGDTVEEEASEEDAPKPKPRNRAHVRINQITREKHQLQNRLLEMEQKYRQLENDLSYTHMAASKHFDDSVNLQLEKAKQLKKDAYESGDTTAMTDADVVLAKATHSVQQSNLWKAQQAYQEQGYQPPEPQYDPRQAEGAQWAQRSSWFYKGTPDYNAPLANHVSQVVDEYEDTLKRNGQEDAIGSREYFQEIDAYVASVMDDFAEQPQRKTIKMNNQNQRHIAPAGRSSMPSRAPTKETYRLTPEDAELADGIGMPHKEYIKHILSERQAAKNRRNSNDY